jgi:carbamoyl-phosphate synthase large subunit
MKVLLIAAGRRVSLAQRFIAHGFQVFSYETEVQCPISTVATIVEGRRWDDSNIRQHLVDTISDIRPSLVLPLADKATKILSSIVYPGIVTGSGRTNEICLNKKRFEEYFQNHDCYPGVEKGKPVIFKPIEGANSKGLKRVMYEEYLQLREGMNQTHVAQRLVDGFEISVDAYFNRFSKMIDAVPRKRIEVQGGEVSRSITLERDAHGVVELTKKMGERIGLVGPVCAQYIVDDKPYMMEINARFGGGVILSMEAGFDQVQLLKDEWIDKKPCSPRSFDWKSNFGMTRYFSEYFYGENDG